MLEWHREVGGDAWHLANVLIMIACEVALIMCLRLRQLLTVVYTEPVAGQMGRPILSVVSYLFS